MGCHFDQRFPLRGNGIFKVSGLPTTFGSRPAATQRKLTRLSGCPLMIMLAKMFHAIARRPLALGAIPEFKIWVGDVRPIASDARVARWLLGRWLAIPLLHSRLLALWFLPVSTGEFEFGIKIDQGDHGSR